jgi:small-conductance mechanosensitive channel
LVVGARSAALVSSTLAIALGHPGYAQELPGLEVESKQQLSGPAAGSVAPEATPEDDRAIAERLGEIYHAVEELDGVGVDVRSGVVRLDGEVLSDGAAERAVRIARQLRGVVEVVNEIQTVSDIGRRLAPTLERIGDRATDLLRLLPLFGVAVAVFVSFCAVAWLATHWVSPYRRLVRNAFACNLLRQVTRAAIVSGGAVVALEILDATAIVAAVAGIAGLAGLAISFAFRDLVENYIASVLLSLRHPFLPNDHVVIQGNEGRVVRLTSRATVLIDFAGNHVRIPNATVFKSVIQNFTRNPQRRFDFTVGVAPDTDLADALDIGIRTLARLPGALAEPPSQGWIEQLGDWNVLLHFYAWIDQRETDWFRTRSEGIRAVKEAFDASGIAMPEPTQRIVSAAWKDDEKTVERRRASATGEPELELDTSPDSHLERAVEHDRARAGPDLLDPSAPQE